MKILYIARTGLGAMGEAALSNYVRLVRKHHAVEVIQTPSAEDIVAPPPPGLRIHDAPAGPAAVRRRAVFDVLRAARPDIVHMIQSPRCYDDLMTLQPVFPQIRWCLDFRSPHVGPPDAPILARFQDMHLQVDCLMTHSLESLRTNVRRRWRRAVEIPPGVDAAAIPSAPGAREGSGDAGRGQARRLVYIGSLSRTRRIDALIEMVARAARDVPGLHLDIYGAGNAEVALREIVARRALSDHIAFRGHLDQAAIWRRLANYDAGLAYVPDETFASAPSLKSIEYAAAGLPVLASRTPGHVAFARRHGFGFEFFDNAPDGLALLLRGETGGLGLQSAAKLRANRRAAEALDWTRIVEERLLPVYARLVR